MTTTPSPAPPFGRALCAMVTPFAPTGALDPGAAGYTAGAARLHARLLPLAERMTASGLPGTVTAKALLGGPVREPLLPAGREDADGLRALYEELLRPDPGVTVPVTV